MESPNTPCSMTSHQAIMKCPWQWRQPFLDEKLESRKRKVGDGYFYDPVDPNFVDHLLPGSANSLETDEKEKIQMEIQRLMTKKEEQADRMFYDALFFLGDKKKTKKRHDKSSSSSDSDKRSDADLLLSPQCPSLSSDDEGSSSDDVSQENMALIDSILLMTKSVDESSLLASPKSVSSPLSPLLEDEDEEDSLSLNSSSDASSSFDEPMYERSTSLDLVSDNLQDNYFVSEDGDLLDFPTSSTSSD